jgi:diguanylate cyclase (GGDEF)-like protein
LRFNGDTAPIVLTLLAWSRRLIAAFIALGLLALGWSFTGMRFEGRHISLDTGPIWPAVVVLSSAAVVAAALSLRYLARNIDSQVRYLGSLDVLTGLSNRSGVMTRLERPQIAVLYMDLDKFKSINDGMGHDMGDEVLKTVAARLKRILRPSDLAARLGGDEFVVVIEDADVQNAARSIAERIRESLAVPIRAERREVVVTSSIGVAIKSPDLSTGQELLRAADLALYRAKRQGRNRVVLFNEAVEANILQRLDLEKDLWRAMDRGELELQYLPEVNLQTGQTVGAEALVRWRHPNHGLLRPASFIAMAEETGSVNEIGLWAVETACRQWGEMRRALPSQPPVNMSVNV